MIGDGLRVIEKEQDTSKFVKSMDAIDEGISESIIQLNTALLIQERMNEGGIDIREMDQAMHKFYEALIDCEDNIHKALLQFLI